MVNFSPAIEWNHTEKWNWFIIIYYLRCFVAIFFFLNCTHTQNRLHFCYFMFSLCTNFFFEFAKKQTKKKYLTACHVHFRHKGKSSSTHFSYEYRAIKLFRNEKMKRDILVYIKYKIEKLKLNQRDLAIIDVIITAMTTTRLNHLYDSIWISIFIIYFEWFKIEYWRWEIFQNSRSVPNCLLFHGRDPIQHTQ